MNKNRFPIIYKIARDYLAILGTSTPSEATFSKANNIVTKSRNRLLPNTIKQLIILKELNSIGDEEELINDNLLSKDDLDIQTSRNKGKNKEIVNLEEDFEEQGYIEDKSSTSITSYNSNSSNVLYHRAGYTTEPATFSWHREHHVRNTMQSQYNTKLSYKEGRIKLAL
jgi:hypothetical protein